PKDSQQHRQTAKPPPRFQRINHANIPSSWRCWCMSRSRRNDHAMASTPSSKPDESGQNPLENATVDPCNNLDRKQYFQFDSVAHAAAAGQRSRYAESLTMSKTSWSPLLQSTSLIRTRADWWACW